MTQFTRAHYLFPCLSNRPYGSCVSPAWWWCPYSVQQRGCCCGPDQIAACIVPEVPGHTRQLCSSRVFSYSDDGSEHTPQCSCANNKSQAPRHCTPSMLGFGGLHQKSLSETLANTLEAVNSDRNPTSPPPSALTPVGSNQNCPNSHLGAQMALLRIWIWNPTCNS